MHKRVEQKTTAYVAEHKLNDAAYTRIANLKLAHNANPTGTWTEINLIQQVRCMNGMEWEGYVALRYVT